MSMFGWSGGAAAAVPPGRGSDLGSVFAASAATAVAELSATETFDGFAVARMTDRSWTGLAARSGALPDVTGLSFPVGQSACHHLLVDRLPVLARDLRRHRNPVLRTMAREHGVTSYVGAPLRRADGRLLGSVCGYTVDRWAGSDPGGLAGRVGDAADALGRQLSAALDAVADDRRAAYDRALASRDDVTGLPDRRGWGLLLQDEDDRARHLAEDLSVVVLDVGLVRSVRGVRRAAHVLRDELGDVSLSRLGNRQFGVVGGDLAQLDPAATATRAQDALRAAGYAATSGWAVREPLESVVSTWWRAEDALVRVRSGSAAG
ncbi:GGDEF domain-containing protein, diguanylate cyclase (c-di-GMP synthetase) or its enzymatically inactive variants [Klenkia soli]|uniref:GGDEF domain-containing protein, diguanylate cyclase (C-di-GMP synthetase) or its enzymatically inactive variants n=1 Tax=Klenkia soli TaxID=1052260 RepID=A0A1H0JLU0_9ACTN|nr:GAF domain-containing protein [Klenkia soli]SDO44453.1 GGDEF domain-containing protein, diguanylate cyclase (c-di-GMP synthetase) or its enzymatically inactive variants [Klenkia soli]